MSDETSINSEEQQPNVPEYKVGQKKTVAEYAALDAEDESLRKWKESLGISTSAQTIGDPSDTRKVVVLEMIVYVEGMEPLHYNLEDPKVVEELKKKPITIKEKAKYHQELKFRVQHEIVTGLKYTMVTKRAGIRANKIEEPCGSYPPSTAEKPFYIRRLPEGEAPSGMLARGTYTALSTLTDDDKVVHMSIPWTFEIKK
uniref:ARAD1C29546p n=1 Tax=Blastobotrys adeninivorans TaxID=409370 RepID=A0A060T2P0_BLAAD